MQTVKDFSDDECPMMAASLAYYTIFSLAPLLVIVISIAGLVWGNDAVRGQIEHQMRDVVGDAGVQQTNAMLDAAENRKSGAWGTVVSIAVLLFGATGVMVQLQYALNKVFEVKPDPKQGGVWQFISKRLLSFAMILAIAFLLIVSLVVTTVLTAVGDQITSRMSESTSQVLMMAIDLGISLLVIGLLFSVLIKWLPDVKLSWGTAFLAGFVTAMLFLLGKFVLGIYLGRQEESAYGPAASLVLILIWVYYSSMIFMFGAEFAQAWAQRGGRRVPPAEGAVPRERATVS
jgi:membrane protein